MNDTIHLTHGWTVKINDKTIPASVPGDVTRDAYNANLIPDPYFGLNHEKIRFVTESDVTYMTRFCVPEKVLSNDEVLISFSSVDTFSEIYLNGKLLGKTENMFLKYEYSVKDILLPDDNELIVKFTSTIKVMNGFDTTGYFGVFNDKRIFVRKAQCHFGWDWAPDMPGYGICGDVTLKGVSSHRIQDVTYKAMNDGNVTIFAELNYTVRPKMDFKGNVIERNNVDCVNDIIRYTLYLLPGAPDENSPKIVSESKVKGRKNFKNFVVSSPELWYPNGYGNQPVYFYKVELLHDGKVIDASNGKLAFREVKLLQKPMGEDAVGYRFAINGKEVFIKGSNWVPCECFVGLAERGKYEKLIRMAKEGNLNALRVWGGGIYEKDEFYDLCDEYGILIWQDFMFACSDIPEENKAFVDNVEKEVVYQVKRLRNHPCLFYWSGGNEKTGSFGLQDTHGDYFIDVILRGLVESLDGTRPYAKQSPCSLTDAGNDCSSGDCHAGCYEASFYNSPLKYRNNLAKTKYPFISECAVMSVGSLQSLEKIFPKDKIWAPNEYWQDRLMDNPYGEIKMNFVDKQFYYTDALYGKSEAIRPFLAKTATVHSEVLRAEIEYARINGDYCGGFMNWMYNDMWPSATWSVIGYDTEAKAPYYQMKRSYEDVLITFTQTENGTVLAVACDAESFSGEVTYGLKDLNGNLLTERKENFDVRSGSVAIKPIDFNYEIPNAYLFAEAFSDGRKITVVYSYDMWHGCDFESDYTVRKEKCDDGLKVTVRANKFAKGVTLILPDNYKYEYTDNFFDLEAGEEKTVFVKGAENEADLTVTDFAKETK